MLASPTVSTCRAHRDSEVMASLIRKPSAVRSLLEINAHFDFHGLLFRFDVLWAPIVQGHGVYEIDQRKNDQSDADPNPASGRQRL